MTTAMIRRIKRVSPLLILALMITCSGRDPEPKVPAAKNVEEMARDVSRDVGIVSKSAQGSKGAPIIIIEERHNSKVGQVEHAIALVRLHEKYGLRDVGLEGYLKESGVLGPGDLGGLSPRSDAQSRARVVTRFLETGEIGSSEFLKMVYDDVSLHPVERAEDRGELAIDETVNIPRVYLVAIAANSMSDDERRTALKLKGVSDHREMGAYVISTDAWTNSKDDVLNSEPSTEVEFDTVRQISERAESLGVELSPKERAAMQARLDFLRRRVNASAVMAQSVAEMADRAGVQVVALNVGTGHTQAVCDKLQAEGRPFAVITPNSMQPGVAGGTFTAEQMILKYRGQSPDAEDAVNRQLSQTLARGNSGRLKPLSRLALKDNLFRAKAELHDTLDRVAHVLLGGGGSPPTGSPTPPDALPVPSPREPRAGMLSVAALEAFRSGPPDEYAGEFVAVNRVGLVSVEIPDTDRQALAVPVTLNHKGASPTQVWFVLELREGSAAIVEARGGGEGVEALLLKILQKVKTGEAEVRKTMGRAKPVQISVDVSGIMAATKEEAVNAISRH